MFSTFFCSSEKNDSTAALSPQAPTRPIDALAGSGVHINRGDARTTVAALGGNWLQHQRAVLKPSSVHPLESSWRIHVRPAGGAEQVGEIRHSDIRGWVTEISVGLGATSVIRAHGILDIAVRDHFIPDNPARGIPLPKKQPKDRIYLTHADVHELAHRSLQPALVYVLAYAGLR